MNAFLSNPQLRRYLWPVAGLLLLLLINLIISPEFFNLTFKDGRFYGSLIDVLNRAAPIALLAIGMTLVIATGGVDLSVGSVMAIAGAVSAYLIVSGVDSLTVIIAGGLAAGLVGGMINGLLVGYMNIQPIVATLILMVAGRGVAQLTNEGQSVTFQHEAFSFLGTGYFLELPFSIILGIITFVLVEVVLCGAAVGFDVEAVGAKAPASRYLGIKARVVELGVFCLAGRWAAPAGMIAAADVKGSDANNAGL